MCTTGYVSVLYGFDRFGIQKFIGSECFVTVVVLHASLLVYGFVEFKVVRFAALVSS